MAASPVTERYAHRSMYDGSAAYDLGRREWYEDQREHEEKQQQAPRPKTAARPREAYGFSPLAAVGAVVASDTSTTPR